MANEKTLESLKQKRTQVINRLQRIKAFVEDHTGDEISSVRARYQIALNAIKEFNEIQEKIEEITALTELGAENAERVQFENVYFDTIGQIESLIERYNDKKQHSLANTSEPQPPSQTATKVKINLPTIELPEFSGNYAEWLSFRDIFKSLVHENPNLTEIEKMHYLRTTLKGEALRALEALTVSSANYNAAI